MNSGTVCDAEALGTRMIQGHRRASTNLQSALHEAPLSYTAPSVAEVAAPGTGFQSSSPDLRYFTFSPRFPDEGLLPLSLFPI